MTLLITRPRHDLVTHYFYYWTESLIQDAKARGLRVFNLEKNKASIKIVESYLKKQNPTIAVFNGHGNGESVAGQDDSVLIKAGQNSSLLRGKNVYMRTCDAGKVLGIRAVQEGAKSFIGYKEFFHLWTDPAFFNQPLKDELARSFLECSNQIISSLIKGKSAKESQKKSQQSYRTAIRNLLTSEAENSFILPSLLWNMENQVLYE